MTDPRHDDVRDHGAADHDAERLVQLLGRALEQREPVGGAAHDRLLDWLARDARIARDAQGALHGDGTARALAARRREEQGARRFARQVLARHALARAMARAGVLALDAPRADRASAAARGSVAASLAAAADAGCAPLVELRVAAGAGRALWEQECERWVELPASLPRGSYVALGVSGDSMLPLLADGDTVLVRLGEQVRAGAVIVARRGDDEYVVKQVGGITSRALELHSLNAAYAPVRVARRAGTVLGTVVARWRGVREG